MSNAIARILCLFTLVVAWPLHAFGQSNDGLMYFEPELFYDWLQTNEDKDLSSVDTMPDPDATKSRLEPLARQGNVFAQLFFAHLELLEGVPLSKESVLWLSRGIGSDDQKIALFSVEILAEVVFQRRDAQKNYKDWGPLLDCVRRHASATCNDLGEKLLKRDY